VEPELLPLLDPELLPLLDPDDPELLPLLDPELLPLLDPELLPLLDPELLPPLDDEDPASRWCEPASRLATLAVVANPPPESSPLEAIDAEASSPGLSAAPSSPVTTKGAPSSPLPFVVASSLAPPLDPMSTPELLPLPPELLVTDGVPPSTSGVSLFGELVPTAQSTERSATRAALGNRYCLCMGEPSAMPVPRTIPLDSRNQWQIHRREERERRLR
jgi:hypothetical protein